MQHHVNFTVFKLVACVCVCVCEREREREREGGREREREILVKSVVGLYKKCAACGLCT